MQRLAEAFATAGVASLRFNFPYMQAGKRRVDGRAVAMESIQHAADQAAQLTGLPLLLGGHSFGGRMASHLAAEAPGSAIGLIYCSFPLHPARKPATERAAHLGAIGLPQLFLSGTRDDLADTELLQQVVSDLPDAKVCWLPAADHGFNVRKRDRQAGGPDVYQQAAVTAASCARRWLPARQTPGVAS